ncbi:TetR-like C-terminal domain-containing protein [Niallia oryzisoli]|uniref:TetR-like C-terminal domain-containing protein n=1 Tax=Niallia oryzisoli TaxID=1737571 RepID=A0ABZ2C7J8_9BACI
MLISIRKTYWSLEKEVFITDLTLTTIFDHFLANKDFYKLMLRSNLNHDFREKLIKLMKQHFREDIEFITDEQVDLELFYSFRVHGLIGFISNGLKTISTILKITCQNKSLKLPAYIPIKFM